jgi:hypothetical protein
MENIHEKSHSTAIISQDKIDEPLPNLTLRSEFFPYPIL